MTEPRLATSEEKFLLFDAVKISAWCWSRVDKNFWTNTRLNSVPRAVKFLRGRLTKFFDDVQKNFGAGVVLIMGVVDNNEHFAPENIAEA